MFAQYQFLQIYFYKFDYNWYQFTDVMLNNLKDNFQLLAYDQRGLGQTQIPDGPYTMKDYADDAACIIEKFGWKKSLILGVSFGGMVAQHLAIKYPSLVQKLVLLCTSSGGKHHSYPLHELEDLDPEAHAKKLIS